MKIFKMVFIFGFFRAIASWGTTQKPLLVSSSIGLADYVDAKVEAEVGKNVLLLLSKIDLKFDETNKKIDDTNKKIESLKTKIDCIDRDFKVGKKTFQFLSIIFFGVATTSAGVFFQDYVIKKIQKYLI